MFKFPHFPNNNISRYFFIFTLSLAATQGALAHSRWIVPSHTIISGDTTISVTFDLSISNDIFHADLALGGRPLHQLVLPLDTDKESKEEKLNPMQDMMRSVKLFAQFPNGETIKELPLVALGRKSAATLNLDNSGSYRIYVDQPSITFTSFDKADGTHGRLFGDKKTVSEKLPKTVKNIVTRRLNPNIETYVTRNQLTMPAIEPHSKGIAIKFLSHPNDLFVNEPAKFQLMLNGKPVPKGSEVKITQSNTRYRNERQSIFVSTEKDGEFTVEWQAPGMHLLEVELAQPSKDPHIDEDIYALFSTLEVNPE